MFTPRISVINQSTVVTDAQGKALTQALQVQVSRDFAPIWGLNASLTYVPKGKQPAPGSWWLVILDTADQAGALGYHEITSEDQPLGKIFAKTTIQDGGTVSVTASHECLEMLGDPHVNLLAQAGDNGSQMQIVAMEVADAVEADNLGYMIGNVLVSDFVLPAYFDPAAKTGPFDFKRHVQKPYQILPGGYLSVLTAADQGWQQVTADKSPHHSSEERYEGNRYHRRRLSLFARKRSTAHPAALTLASDTYGENAPSRADQIRLELLANESNFDHIQLDRDGTVLAVFDPTPVAPVEPPAA